MRFPSPIGVPLVVGIVLAAVASAPAQAPDLGAEALAYRAHLAAGYMAAVQRPDGTFGYEYDFVLGRFLEGDNIVRQTGAGFGLAEYLKRSGDGALREPVERAIAAYDARSIAFGGGLVVSGDGTFARAWTGATALALLAEVHYFEETGDDRFAALRRAWLEGLKALQLASGGFAEYPGSEEESDYFNGETWLALAHYVRLFPDDHVTAGALARADAHLMEYYTRAPSFMFFHWGMRAATVRFATTGEARFVDFVAMHSWLFVNYMDPELAPEWNSCALVEGLASAAKALRLGDRASDLAYAPVRDRSRRELAKDLGMQIMPGQTRLALGEDRHLLDTALDRFAGAFLNGRYSPRTRIDATTHCLWAMMRYADAGSAD